MGVLPAQTLPPALGVGDGAPTSALELGFVQAFDRGSFATSVIVPPIDKVHAVGSGYVQDFDDSNPSEGFSFVLAAPNSVPGAVYQMCCQILALHTSIGSFTGKVGYPITDFMNGLVSPVDGSIYSRQNFESGYILFAYQSGARAGQAFFVEPPFAAPWQAAPSAGPPVSEQLSTTSKFGTTGTEQDFQGGVIVQITSGLLNGSLFTVSGAIFQLYSQTGSTTSSYLGYPTGNQFLYSGNQRQNFEGGYVDYAPGQPAVAHAPVAAVTLDTTPLALQVGNVVQRTVTVLDATKHPVTDRTVNWTTSSSAVIQITASGATATLRAVGPGFADVIAYVGGVASQPLHITVSSTCCLVGDGAPNSAVRQAMQEALARNGISPRLPTDNAVRRAGAGYVQQFTALSPASLGRFLVVKADNSVQAFVVTGDRLARYEQLGGVAGVLGFATSDANAAGRQLFENNYALAGSPPVLAAAPITPKWAALGYETGAAGLPAADAVPIGFSAFGSAGVAQTFAGGVIYGFTAGPRTGQAYFVSGLILARYSQLNGPAGILGMPISGAFPAGSGRTAQNFEGGFVDFAPGDSAAVEHPASRAPAVSVFPGQAAIGGRVHISISGFAPGHPLAVSITAQPDFQVTPPGGSFGWDVQLRPGVAPGLYRVTVRDTAGSDRADGAYSVRTAAQGRYQLAKVSGDNQSALPASQAAQPLVVRLTDDGGNPIAGASVTFSSIAGASVSPPQAVTDANGYAQAMLRLPPADGLALATAEAGGQVVTFAAHAQDGNLSTFPTFRQAIDNINVGGGAATIHEKGALLTALAALFRYYQDLGELSSANGPADPSTLNQFLLADGYLSFTLGGNTELVVNPARALDFVAAAADFELVPTVDLTAIRDSVNVGRPVLVGLMLHADGVDRGGHYVVATGVGADGSILIYDPSPDWNRTSLSDYLNGFAALGRTWTATILHGLRLSLQARSSRGFLSYAPGSAQLHIAANGGGGYQVRIPALAAFDRLVMDNGDTADLAYRDGTATAYQLSAAAAGVTVRGPATIGPLDAGAFRVNPDPAAFSVTPQAVTATADGLRNAASFGSRLAPGS
ncbi:MAG TPA: Ig-like domain-containing protein, partial [Bryobacterales bacterium]|nr:Ig-like domain-containing protein [Bryobacterales bacterium]